MSSFPAEEAPPTLTAFLAEHRVPQYESIFLEIGYDDVEDFANFDDRTVDGRFMIMCYRSGTVVCDVCE